MFTKRTDNSRLVTESDNSPHDRPEQSFSRFSGHAMPVPRSYSVTQKEPRTRTSDNSSRVSRLETLHSHHKEPELTRMDPVYVGRLETIIEQKNQEINKMLHLNSFLEKAVKKREELAKLYFEENTKLKETLKNKDKTIEIFKRKLEDALKSQPQISTVTLPEGSSIRFLPRGSTAGSGSKTERFSKANETLDARESTRDVQEMTLGGAGPWVLTERKGQTGINFAPKRSLSSANLAKQQKLHDLVEEKGLVQPKERAAIDVRTKATVTMKAVKVTESQGRKDFESMFLGGSGRVSVLDMEDKDLKKMLGDGKLKDFEELMTDTDKFRDIVRKSSDQKLGDLMDVIKSIVKDFKNILGIVLSLKKLVKANSAISVSLILNDALERIVSEACNILHCDRASVFIVDEANQELWTKLTRGSNSTIRIPINSGIAGHVVSTGRSVRIDEAYLDPRFDQEVDRKGHYRTKTILAVPVKDFTGRVIGVCQAVNKTDGIFSPDDEGICQLLANQAGVMLKNSLQFDQNLVTHQKLIRLLKIGSEMYEADRYSILIQKIENGLKEIMLSSQANAYIINEKGDGFFNFDESGTMMMYPINSGIAGHVAQTGEIMDIHDPYNHPYFNSLVDIETKLPLLCLPVFSTKDPKKIIAVMQTLDLKIAGRGGGKQDLIESETIRLFQIQIGVCLEQFAKLKALQADLQEEGDQVRRGFNS